MTFQHPAFVIHDAPKIVHLAVDLDMDLIERQPRVPKALHPIGPLAPEISGNRCPEPLQPQPDHFVTDVDAALGQQVLDGPQRLRETVIHHPHKADEPGR